MNIAPTYPIAACAAVEIVPSYALPAALPPADGELTEDDLEHVVGGLARMWPVRDGDRPAVA